METTKKAKSLLAKGVSKATNNLGELVVKPLKPIPENLYKYYSLMDYNIKGIYNNTIFFSQVHLLNDILEGNFKNLWNFETFKDDSLIEEIHKEKIINTTDYEKEFLEIRGIFSACEDYKNDLLWVHYTQESGYCLEINTHELLNYLEQQHKNDYWFYPINYPQNLSPLPFDNYIELYEENHGNFIRNYIDINLPIFYTLSTKEHHWHYEKEWRILLRSKKFNYIVSPTQIIDDKSKEIENKEKKGGNIEISDKVIEKVILAPHFFNNSRFNHYYYNKDLGVELFHFKNNDEGKLAYDFLNVINQKYPNNIYQVDKILQNNVLQREISKSIEIIDISESYVKTVRKEIKQ